MADYRNIKGGQPPVTDYTIGNGGIRDLFKYILGDEDTRSNMKIVKTVKGKKTVVQNPKQKNAIVNTVKRVMSNDVSRRAGERAQRIQDEMAANMGTMTPRVTGEDVTNRLREQTMVNYNTPDQDAPINITAGDGPIKVRPQRGYNNLSMRGENVIYRAGPRRRGDIESYQRGEPTIRVDDAPPSAYENDPEFAPINIRPAPEEYSLGVDTIGYKYGGKVKTKKRRKKKVKKTYGKSYNY